MLRKTVSFIGWALLLMGMLTLAFDIQQAKASGTIYIRADGSVDPDTAPISSADNITYILTGNIYDSIDVERDNIVVDGAGYTVQGIGSGVGIDLSARSNVTIENMNISTFYDGVYLRSSSDNVIFGNNLVNNDRGVFLYTSSKYNTISGNNITNNELGVLVRYASDNSISGNNITNNNDIGILLSRGSKFTGVYGNNITKSNKGIYLYDHSQNNAVSGNNVAFNKIGVLVRYASNNTISGNNIANNDDIGIRLQYSSNNSITGNQVINNNISRPSFGIDLYDGASHNIVSRNNITANWNGVRINDIDSFNNTISENNITNNGQYGVGIIRSSNNTFSGNRITENPYGIYVWGDASDNSFYHNNFIDNTGQVHIETSGYTNFWDDGYPCCGNYWSDYAGIDENHGPNQDILGSDGIGDTPYIIDADNIDHFPLIHPCGSPHEGLWSLTRQISANLQQGIEKSLTTMLRNAINSLDKNLESVAVEQLKTFIHYVEALKERKLTNEQADYLSSEAQRIIYLIT